MGTFVDKRVHYGKTGDFFQHCRDGYKALHVIRRFNQHGQFLEISEFHSGSHQGVLRVLEGKARQGWSNFSFLCKSIWNRPAAVKVDDGVCDCRRGVIGALVSSDENRMLRISPIDPKFENHVTVAMNSAMGVKENPALEGNSDPEVNACVDITLNLTLVCGPGGNWTVSQAQIVKNNSQVSSKPISHAYNPDITNKVIPGGLVQHKQKEWRPKAPVGAPPSPRPISVNLELVDPNLEHSFSVVPSLELTQNSPSLNVVTSPNIPETHTWEMLLREGKRIFTPSIPPMPPIPLSINPFHALLETCLETARGEQSVEVWDDEASESSLPLELSNNVVGGELGEDGSWDDEAIWVELLAISFPVVEESPDKLAQVRANGVTDVVLAALKKPQSDWVM